MRWASVRIGFLVAAGLVSLQAIVSRFDPHYWDPHSIVDYLAVALTTAMLLALAVAFASLAVSLRRSGFRAPAVALVAAAVASATAGISNVLEDALRWQAFGSGFVYSMPLLVVSVAIAGVATLITGRAWSLGSV